MYNLSPESKNTLLAFNENTALDDVSYQGDVWSAVSDGCSICVTVCPVNARYCPPTLSGKAPEVPPEKHQLFQVKGGKCELLNLEHCRRLESEGRERECRVCETYCPREAIKIEYV